MYYIIIKVLKHTGRFIEKQNSFFQQYFTLTPAININLLELVTTVSVLAVIAYQLSFQI